MCTSGLGRAEPPHSASARPNHFGQNFFHRDGGKDIFRSSGVQQVMWLAKHMVFAESHDMNAAAMVCSRQGQVSFLATWAKTT